MKAILSRLVQMLTRTRVAKWLGPKLNWFVSLFRAKDIRYLVWLMAVLLLVGLLDAATDAAFAHWKWEPWPVWVWLRKILAPFKGLLGYSFVHLFSPEKAAEKWLTMIVFFVGWLIGGGVLVTVMVGQYYKNMEGGFRRWQWLVENHLVVLGWDDGMLTELKQAVSAGKHACYIVTKQNVPELAQSLKSAGVKDCYIYKGDYDNPEEWRDNLQIHKAAKVFIAGERNEAAHDARVRLLFEKIKAVCKDSGKPRITVNIHDFGLAQKLMAEYPETFENFHMNWADALWDGIAIAKALKPFDLYVVGFGAMGKAVAISAIRRFIPQVICITDDDKEKLEEEKARFKTQFNDFEVDDNTFLEWNQALAKFRDLPNKNNDAVIVVAKKRSEKGLFCMMDIISQLQNPTSPEITLALNQEIDGYSVDSDIKLKVGKVDVKIFGMKKGRILSPTLAQKKRNPDTPLLRQYASKQGDALLLTCGIPNVRYFLGGALAYDAALVGSYDIDLRLLVPDAGKTVEEVRRQIDSVKDLLAERAKGNPTFETWFIDEGGGSYIWHTKQIVKVPGIPGDPDIELSWNIQAESSYQSLADMAARLPEDVIDRYVVAKWNARQAGDATYRALKADWKSLLSSLIERGAKGMDRRALSALLAKMSDSFPAFLK